MFGMSMPDDVNRSYIFFYYRLIPTARFLAGIALLFHTLIVLKLIAGKDDERLFGEHPSETYSQAMMWVWLVVSGAPFTLKTKNSYEDVVGALCMGIAVVFQGYVIGAMSMLMGSFNVKDQNRLQLLEMMATLEHFHLPSRVQHEVLSFQHHVMEDSSLNSNTSIFDRLPPSITRQIQLHMKVQVLSKVRLFGEASENTLMEIAATMEQLIVAPETEIITCGEVGECMYFMNHGLADVILLDGTVVATLRRGDFFGEVALLDPDAKRKAT
eukprot:PhM_4_TR2449/c0_g2_i1/m.12666